MVRVKCNAIGAPELQPPVGITLNHAQDIDELCHSVKEAFPKVVRPFVLFGSSRQNILEVGKDTGGTLKCLCVEVAVKLELAGRIPLALAFR